MMDDNARAIDSSGRQHGSSAAHVVSIRIHGDDLQGRALCQRQGQLTGAAAEVETVALGDAGTIQDGLGSRRTRALGVGGGGRRGRGRSATRHRSRGRKAINGPSIRADQQLLIAHGNAIRDALDRRFPDQRALGAVHDRHSIAGAEHDLSTGCGNGLARWHVLQGPPCDELSDLLHFTLAIRFLGFLPGVFGQRLTEGAYDAFLRCGQLSCAELGDRTFLVTRQRPDHR